MRAFVKLRDLLASNKTIVQKLSELEHKLESYDEAPVAILSTIRECIRRCASAGLADSPTKLCSKISAGVHVNGFSVLTAC